MPSNFVYVKIFSLHLFASVVAVCFLRKKFQLILVANTYVINICSVCYYLETALRQFLLLVVLLIIVYLFVLSKAKVISMKLCKLRLCITATDIVRHFAKKWNSDVDNMLLVTNNIYKDVF